MEELLLLLLLDGIINKYMALSVMPESCTMLSKSQNKLGYLNNSCYYLKLISWEDKQIPDKAWEVMGPMMLVNRKTVPCSR